MSEPTTAGPLEARVTIPIRWRDLDLLGHINQAVYHEMLEDARGSIFQSLAAAAARHTAYVLVRVELDYRHEVRKDHGHVVAVARVGRVGDSSIAIDHEILLPDGTIAASGTSVVVGWDPETRTKRALEPEERELLGASG